MAVARVATWWRRCIADSARRTVPASHLSFMATATLANSPIKQVSQTPVQTNLQPHLLTRLLLDLRGKRFSVDRETIMNLPESVLLCLFPNGLVLSRQSAALSDGGDNDDYEELYGVDVRTIISHVNVSHSHEHSSILTVSHTFFHSFVTPQRHSMERRILQGCMRLNNTWPREARQLLTSVPRLRRTRCCLNRRLSFFAKSSNISLYRRKTVKPRRTRTESPTKRCWS